VSNLSASISGSSVHLYPLSFRNLHAHLNSHFPCVRESFLASYYPVPLSSALRRRLKDKTKIHFRIYFLRGVLALSLLDLFIDSPHLLLCRITIDWWMHLKVHDRSRLSIILILAKKFMEMFSFDFDDLWICFLDKNDNFFVRV